MTSLIATSQVKLSEDNCSLHRPIDSTTDKILLQQDIVTLEEWVKDWSVKINASKCNLNSIHRSKHPHTYHYKLDNDND